MAQYSPVMLGWSWTDLSVLDSQSFGQHSAESCESLMKDAFNIRYLDEKLLIYSVLINSLVTLFWLC